MLEAEQFAERVAMCDPQTQQLLFGAGWSPYRQVDISNDVKDLEKEGFTIFPSVRTFLESFNGIALEWSYYNQRSQRDLYTDVWINGSRAADSLFSEWIDDYKEALGVGVCPVGKAEHNHFTLLISAEGQMYGVFDELIVEYGANGIEAIDTIVTGKKVKVLREG